MKFRADLPGWESTVYKLFFEDIIVFGGRPAYNNGKIGDGIHVCQGWAAECRPYWGGV
jgi:hypothetical protein